MSCKDICLISCVSLSVHAKLREWGYPTFTEFYLKIYENQTTTVYQIVCTVVWEVSR